MPINQPDVTLSIIPAETFATIEEQKVLIVGQGTSAGSYTSGALNEDVGDATNTINSLFGARSHVAEMVRQFKTINKESQLDVIALDDNGSAVQATSSIAFSGTASADATVFIGVASDRRYRVQVDISSGDTATEIGEAVVAAYSTATQAPFTAAESTGTVTFTAANGGTLANDWTIRFDGSIPGVTTTVTGWASGATDPSLTSIFDVIGTRRYQTIVWPSAYALTELETLLDDRFNSSNAVLDGVGIQAINGTLSGLKSAVSSLNSQSLVIFGEKTIDETFRKGTTLREIPDVTVAKFAAIRSLKLTQDALLTPYLTTSASRDQFGGPALASLPYFNTIIPNMPIPLAEDEFTLVEIDELTDNAVSVIGANRAFNGVICGEVVTTYLTDGAGNPDISYKFLNTVDTASVIRETYFANFKATYAQTRLTDGDLIAGRDMANEQSIRAFCLEVYRVLARQVLVQAGSAAEEDYLQNLLVEVAISTGTVTVNQAPLLVTQLRTIIGTIQINFGE